MRGRRFPPRGRPPDRTPQSAGNPIPAFLWRKPIPADFPAHARPGPPKRAPRDRQSGVGVRRAQHGPSGFAAAYVEGAASVGPNGNHGPLTLAPPSGEMNWRATSLRVGAESPAATRTSRRQHLLKGSASRRRNPPTQVRSPRGGIGGRGRVSPLRSQVDPGCERRALQGETRPRVAAHPKLGVGVEAAAGESIPRPY
jgi:hypothetical protein